MGILYGEHGGLKETKDGRKRQIRRRSTSREGERDGKSQSVCQSGHCG